MAWFSWDIFDKSKVPLNKHTITYKNKTFRRLTRSIRNILVYISIHTLNLLELSKLNHFGCLLVQPPPAPPRILPPLPFSFQIKPKFKVTFVFFFSILVFFMFMFSLFPLRPSKLLSKIKGGPAKRVGGHLNIRMTSNTLSLSAMIGCVIY